MRKNLTLDDLQMIVGPMEGVMTPALIMAANRLRLTNTWMTPFLRVSQELYRDSLVRNFVAPFLAPHAKVIVQLMGNEPDLLSRAVTQLKKLEIADGINLNFGCPSRRVMSGNCGGGALRNIKLMQDIIRKIRDDHADINLSAKIRLGYNDISEMEEIIPALSEGDNLDFMVVHCRVVQEGYRKIDNHYERFAKVKALTRNLPLVVNGDIATRIEGFNYMQKLGAQGFMCARTFLANPFVFIKDVVTDEDKELFYKTTLSVAENDLKCPYTIGKKIELSNLIFGKDNPYFEELKQQNLQSID